MKETDKNNLSDEDKKVALGLKAKQTNERKHVELTDEQRKKRALEVGLLFESRDDLIEARAEREKRKKQEIIELQSGVKFTIGEVERIVCPKARPYDPLFPYSEPFYEQLYRLYYPDGDFKEYPKPPYMGTLTKEIIYNRFDKAVFTALNVLNPLIKGRRRARKLFQHLNDDGQAEVIRFRDDTINVAKTVPNAEPYTFRKKCGNSIKYPINSKFFRRRNKSDQAYAVWSFDVLVRGQLYK
jgi:hypothetical protein